MMYLTLKRLEAPGSLEVRWGGGGCNTTLPWGMTSNTISRYLFNMADTLAAQGVAVDPTVPVHPTFFYEFLWNLLGFLLLAFVLTPRRKYDGQVSLGYMAWYGLGRFFIEGLRTDSLMLGQFRVSQLLALCLCVASLVAMAVLHIRHKKAPAVLYVDTEESRARIAKVDAEMAKDGKKGTEEETSGEDAPPPEGTGDSSTDGEAPPETLEETSDTPAPEEEQTSPAGSPEEAPPAPLEEDTQETKENQ